MCRKQQITKTFFISRPIIAELCIVVKNGASEAQRHFTITLEFREVFAKQKFGKIQQDFSSKSLLYAPTTERRRACKVWSRSFENSEEVDRK
jgi:hypothetical protein